MRKLSLLGSTGSIGVSTLDVVRAFPERFQVVALSAGHNIELLMRQMEEVRPQMVSVVDAETAEELARRWTGSGVDILCGSEGLISCATLPEADMVVSAMVGAAGLVPTMAAIEAGKDIALANKETLVTAGRLMMAAAGRKQVTIIPVDSEHSALFQCLAGQRRSDVKRLILTASGGPFWDYPAAQFDAITPAAALAHPNWDMGQKITIDSATMMNKGLEVIEARWLFDFPAEMIDVHIHPESIVHSLVEFNDGALMAQLGLPDMKTPIAYALSWPERLPLPQPSLDLCQVGRLQFSAPDHERFPCLRLAYEALAAEGTCPAVLNAANEIAVTAFLQGTIGFQRIPTLIEEVLAHHQSGPVASVDQVLRADDWARQAARLVISGGTL